MAQQLSALLSSDYDVRVAQDGQSLIAAVGLDMPDIVISDIAMPGISGLTAAQRILAAHPDCRLIFVSILDEPAVIRRVFAEGACGYVIKADAGSELETAVQAVLGGGSYLSSSARAALESGR